MIIILLVIYCLIGTIIGFVIIDYTEELWDIRNSLAVLLWPLYLIIKKIQDEKRSRRNKKRNTYGFKE